MVCCHRRWFQYKVVNVEFKLCLFDSYSVFVLFYICYLDMTVLKCLFMWHCVYFWSHAKTVSVTMVIIWDVNKQTNNGDLTLEIVIFKFPSLTCYLESLWYLFPIYLKEPYPYKSSLIHISILKCLSKIQLCNFQVVILNYF